MNVVDMNSVTSAVLPILRWGHAGADSAARRIPRAETVRHALALVTGAAVALTVLGGCAREQARATPVQTARVEQRDIVVDAEATGTIEPVNVVEVKSKASGLITKMPVETGSLVKPGDLLVQVDTRDVRNQYDQALADLRAAEAKLRVSGTQRQRSDELFRKGIITAQEHETAALDYANAQAQLVRARASLDLAKQRLEEATVRAPVAGTVIEKTVSLGQVITSATSAFGGGTTLLKMADLDQVRVRALVNETDIGQVRPGQEATVTVDAYPDRPFRGVVEKIEPQAVVEQSVTMFPVLVSLSNRERLLLPGMNGEVSVLIDRRENVLAVPNDAIRSPREAMQVAQTLGLDPNTVRTQLQAQLGAGGSGAPRAARRGVADARQVTMVGDSTPPRSARRMQLVFVSDSGRYMPRIARVGVSSYDYTEVLAGLREGEQVALLSAALLQQQREQRNERIRSVRGGIPGLQRPGTPAGGAGTPAGGVQGGGRP